MGTVIIKNLSRLNETAAMFRVAFYMNGNSKDAEFGGIVVREEISKRDKATNKRSFVVCEK